VESTAEKLERLHRFNPPKRTHELYVPPALPPKTAFCAHHIFMFPVSLQ